MYIFGEHWLMEYKSETKAQGRGFLWQGMIDPPPHLDGVGGMGFSPAPCSSGVGKRSG